MTMRSKQWYTKTSRLSNSFANNSIGRLLDFASQRNHRSGDRWSQRGLVDGIVGREERVSKGKETGRFRSLWATSPAMPNTRSDPSSQRLEISNIFGWTFPP